MVLALTGGCVSQVLFCRIVPLQDLKNDAKLFHSCVQTYQSVACLSFLTGFKIAGMSGRQSMI